MSNILSIKRPDHFDLDKIFDCGQSFRFEKGEDGFWQGVAFGKLLRTAQYGKNVYIESREEYYENVWKKYLSLDEDYEKICPWAKVVSSGMTWPAELTDAAVELFESEKNNREQRRKKREEREKKES